MAASSCFASPLIPVSSQLNYYPSLDSRGNQNSVIVTARTAIRKIYYQKIGKGNLWSECSFLGKSGASVQPIIGRKSLHRKNFGVSASFLSASQIASSAFTWGTVAVLPFYTFMVAAPRSDLTKKLMGNGTPFVALGVVYAYLLYLSWTPDTLRFMFSSKYWLPELPGMAQMFANEMTLASAWIHLLVVDLYAAKQVYEDGMQNDVEIRHSVLLCLLFCPIGILVHIMTKALVNSQKGKRTIQ
ncbi:unnamed protein product [Cuscuta europaea]|uniref:Neoxanthin synthase n=1 Tax=Cuscuta europaea TaxID=41803 RepID=A0A9P1EHG2_CUSEU|nr:unnamed protein product [Cuscuta europaea]